jgi:pimeloyl-ACP methyl ester carboxylesterase
MGFDVYCLNWYNLTSTNQKFDSSFIVKSILDFLQNTIGKEVFLLTHSASGAFGWKLAEGTKLIKKVIAIAPAPPGNIQDTPNYILSDNKKTISVLHLNSVPYTFSLEESWVADISWVKKKAIGLETTHFSKEFLDEYLKSLVSVPSLIMYERMNIESSQIKVDIEKIKENNPNIYIFTGDKDISHSYKIDKAIDEYFKENQINSHFYWLADYGFQNNGHMLMLQNNSEEIINFIISHI